MKPTHILGIDISKDKFDVCLRPVAHCEAPAPRAVFDNTPAGFKKLRAWLKPHCPARLHACLEATSRYGDALAHHLHAEGHTVSVVNPRRIRRYAESLLVRTRHDALDAEIIAQFGATQEPPAWQPPAPARRQLQDLTRLRQFLVRTATRLQNRRHTEVPALAAILTRQLRQLDREVAGLDQRIAAHLQTDADLQAQVALADSVPGVGPVIAAAVVAELPPVAQLEHAGQAVALAGLDPRKKDSGSSVRGGAHLSRMGSRPLRQALYMGGVVAQTHNPLVKALAGRLKAKGRTGKTVVVASMRKLLRLIYGVLKTGVPFDPEWQGRDRAVPCAGAGAGGGEGLPSPQLASPPVATA